MNPSLFYALQMTCSNCSGRIIVNTLRAKFLCLEHIFLSKSLSLLQNHQKLLRLLAAHLCDNGFVSFLTTPQSHTDSHLHKFTHYGNGIVQTSDTSTFIKATRKVIPPPTKYLNSGFVCMLYIHCVSPHGRVMTHLVLSEPVTS